MNDKIFKIFVDFDGTITTQDVGEAFVNRFGRPDEINEIVRKWMEEKITSPESWHLMFNTFSSFSQDGFDELLKEIKIDPFFKDFVQYCRSIDARIRVLSDGFDIYIREILKREGLSDLDVFSNKAEITGGNKIIPHFPYSDEECRFCGNCKRNHILTNSGDDDYIVYIGDGYSDKCPVQYCDFVFAKGSLLRYCEMNRITFFPFRDFSDVTKRLNELNGKKRLKKRHQADLRRREVFKQG